jgi:hypothetical protein
VHDKTVPIGTGGSVKRSLAMVLPGCDETIAKAFGLDDATRNFTLTLPQSYRAP